MMDDIFLQLAKLTDPNAAAEQSGNKPSDAANSRPSNAPGDSPVKPSSGIASGNSSSSLTGVVIKDQELPDEIFVYDELVTPDLKPKKNTSGKPQVLVIDDDFPTLDLMKIYLQREYEYIPFDNPKDAIFWLNTHIPNLIFIDCYMTLINPRRIIEIIKSNKSTADVPIFYLSEPDELGPISGKLPDGVLGVISRPVSRGDLQGVLNYVFQYGTSCEPNEDDDDSKLLENLDDILNSLSD